ERGRITPLGRMLARWQLGLSGDLVSRIAVKERKPCAGWRRFLWPPQVSHNARHQRPDCDGEYGADQELGCFHRSMPSGVEPMLPSRGRRRAQQRAAVRLIAIGAPRLPFFVAAKCRVPPLGPIVHWMGGPKPWYELPARS